MAKRDRSRTPSDGSVPRSSGEYNVVGRTEPVTQAELTQPPSVIISPVSSEPVRQAPDPLGANGLVEQYETGDHAQRAAEDIARAEATGSPDPTGHDYDPLVAKGQVDKHETEDDASRAAADKPAPLAEATLRPRPNARFRASALKIVQIHRTSDAMSPGAEPGADPRRESASARWGHIQADCRIEVVEYSPAKMTSTKLDNQGLHLYITGRGKEKPAWAKVRWINVAGISWDVVSALTLRYGLHPLAAEDVLRRHGRSTRSKSDYYRTHLYIQVLSHSLGPDEAPPSYTEATYSQSPTKEAAPTSPGTRPPIQQGQKPDSFWKRAVNRGRDDIESTLGKDSELADIPQAKAQWPNPFAFTSATSQRTAANIVAVQHLKRGSNVQVDLQPIYIFLTRDGTFITFCEDRSATLFEPIFARLRPRDTLLRIKSDPSLLMHAVLDLVVDKALEVIDRYHDALLDLERQILIKPSVKLNRQLHIISGDLTFHKRTLAPISTLIYGLRRYDVDRAIASMPDGGDEQKVSGFCSHQTKVYLADVYDHMEYILSSMDMFSSIAENLLNYTFNSVSYETNQVMRRLTLATVLFFPLTFLTGYFGMNFGVMAVHNESEVVFWEIAFPVMFVIITFFLWDDIKKRVFAFEQNKMWHHLTAEQQAR